MAAPTSNQHPDVAVDRFHYPEAYDQRNLGKGGTSNLLEVRSSPNSLYFFRRVLLRVIMAPGADIFFIAPLRNRRGDFAGQLYSYERQFAQLVR